MHANGVYLHYILVLSQVLSRSMRWPKQCLNWFPNKCLCEHVCRTGEVGGNPLDLVTLLPESGGRTGSAFIEIGSALRQIGVFL